MDKKSVSNKLSLVTFNTFGLPFLAPDITKRYAKISTILNKGKYDIICFEEVLTYYQLFLLKRGLSNYPFVVYQKNPLGPRGGLVIFSKLNLTNEHFFTYSYPKKVFVPWYARLAQYGILSCTIPSLSLRLITTHLASDKVHDLTESNKLYYYIKNQSHEVADKLHYSVKKYGSVILAGDFNIAKGSELYQEFIKNTGVFDTFEEDTSPSYDPDRTKFFYRAFADRCDFIFTKAPKQKIKVHLKENILVKPELLSNGKKGYLSDHIGLHCILEIHE